MTAPIDPKDAVKAAGWLERNVPRIFGWIRFWKRGKAKTALVMIAVTMLGCASWGAKEWATAGAIVGAGVKIIGGLPDIPEPPGEATATPTPTPSRPPVITEPTPTPTIEPTPLPTATSTPEPSPTVPPSRPTGAPVPGCMNLSEPPAHAVPIFTGQPCRRAQGFVPVYAKDGTQGCIRQWVCDEVNERCKPGDDCFSPLRRIQASLDNGSVYRCAPGEGAGPEFICDGEDRPGQEAYGRNIHADRTVIVPEGVDHDQPWKRASICGPKPCPATPEPTPTVAGPTPPPGGGPRGDRCTCQVACSVRILGWNDNAGLPPYIVPGGQFSADITCRQAQYPGDQRGQPVDRSNGPEWCEPSKNPVEFDISSPTSYEVGNDGYRVDFHHIEAGAYRISVTPNPRAVYRNGEPITACGWGHNDSVKTVLEFEVR